LRLSNMSEARRLRLYLKLVEYTSIPLTALMVLYILTGYGTISPVLRHLGLSYAFSVNLHTAPMLRWLLNVLVILHGYPGLALLARKKLKLGKLWKAVEVAIAIAFAAYAVVVIYAELYTAFPEFGRGWRFGRG
jgi:hypothetical protein